MRASSLAMASCLLIMSTAASMLPAHAGLRHRVAGKHSRADSVTMQWPLVAGVRRFFGKHEDADKGLAFRVSVDQAADEVKALLDADLSGVVEPEQPRTLLGAVAVEYRACLPYVTSNTDIPVEMLMRAVETQATHSKQLGAFMQLIVKLDEGNMRMVRASWERHGKPAGIRALLEAEKAAGVQQRTRLAEDSAALSLLWSMRCKRFWTDVADGFAGTGTESSSAFGLRAYERFVAPYHGFVLKNTFRAGLRALPPRETMLRNMEQPPPPLTPPPVGRFKNHAAAAESPAADLTAEERRATCLVDLRECSKATRLVTDHVQQMLDELGLQDNHRV
mmetsp:Transcript_75/g.163  ORF Transcript_75/g.163 Transcript_75/m.163 type:complete len:335 (-) Transcript_75:109-1113(-)